MSFTRRFLVCENLVHAAFLDQFALAYMIDMRGVQGAEWSGVWVQVQPGNAPDVYGVEWESPLTELLGPVVEEDTGKVLLPVVDAVTTVEPDGSRTMDWQRLPQPDPIPFP